VGGGGSAKCFVSFLVATVAAVLLFFSLSLTPHMDTQRELTVSLVWTQQHTRFRRGGGDWWGETKPPKKILPKTQVGT
jgi:hypothetical protein